MVNYEKLTKAGIDMESLLKRLMGNASLVRVFIRKFIEDQTYQKLVAAFEARDMKAAEMASHTLKGMCGNLSVTGLYDRFTAQVNCIRGGEYAKAEAMMGEIALMYEGAVAAMKEWLAETL